MVTNEQKTIVLDAVNSASAAWKSAFNSGDAAGCANQYEKDAVMHARPFGTFTGTTEIQGFWQKLIDDGFSDVDYIDPQVEVIDEASAVLTSKWKMNKAGGVIHKELWVLQPNGTAKLREDDFEAQS
ncbi:MAG: isochorismatase [Leptolyngbya sp. SIO1D8]|nr:isochorismatase [Leptolyngbya sp. SIO1D8]